MNEWMNIIDLNHCLLIFFEIVCTQLVVVVTVCKRYEVDAHQMFVIETLPINKFANVKCVLFLCDFLHPHSFLWLHWPGVPIISILNACTVCVIYVYLRTLLLISMAVIFAKFIWQNTLNK